VVTGNQIVGSKFYLKEKVRKSMQNSSSQLQNCIEKIEASYEYMLAYAAQGRKTEPAGTGDSKNPSIRDFLKELIWGMENVTACFMEEVHQLRLEESSMQQIQKFETTLSADAKSALSVVFMVLDAPTLSSQLIDNLNASTHVRTLLTDLFVLDEVIKIHKKKMQG
jgi:hypothetical protein